MIKTQFTSKTLTGGATYDTITDTSIPFWAYLEVYNNTTGDLKFRVNGVAVDETVSPAGVFYLKGENAHEACRDTVTCNGTGTIVVKIQYYDYA